MEILGWNFLVLANGYQNFKFQVFDIVHLSGFLGYQAIRWLHKIQNVLMVSKNRRLDFCKALAEGHS